MVKKTIFIILIIICALIVTYVVLDPETKELNEAARSGLGGSYVRLFQGVTHYSFEGPENGRIIVLVHGATIPMFCWDELLPVLTNAGFRVLRYDMYGRGYSDRPAVTYNRELYYNQLRELLDALKIHEPVDLIGVSMGAGIICDFSAQYPKRVDRIGLISPLVNDVKAPFILKIPVLGECTMRFVGLRRITERVNSLTDPNSPQHKRQAFLFTEQVTHRGFQASFLSMMRNAASADYQDSYMTVGKQNRRVILIWGTWDKEITEDKIDRVRTLIPNMEFHAIKNGTHGILSQNFDQIQNWLIRFFQQER